MAAFSRDKLNIIDWITQLVGLRHHVNDMDMRMRGWKDLMASVAGAAPSPSNAPNLTNFGSAGTMQRQEYAFSTGDYVFMAPFHVNHDIDSGAKAYIHVHWTTNGTNTGTVIWRLHIQRAKGHNQEAFGTPYYIEMTQSASGTAYQHMIAEPEVEGVTTTTSNASDPVLILTEPDELILVTLEREGGTCSDAIFGIQVDFHYQSSRDTTPQKSPNFYKVC